jgi:hypothetical protein
VEPREVHFEKFTEKIEKDKKYDFTIFGITNPAEGTTTGLSLYLTDLDSTNVLAYLEGSITFKILAPPKLLTMTYLSVDNQHLNDVATYEFGFKTGEE